MIIHLPYGRSGLSVDLPEARIHAVLRSRLEQYVPTMSQQELAAMCPQAMKGILQKFGCDITLKDLGVTEEMIEPMTDSVFTTMGGVLNNSLKPFTREDVVQLYKDSM